MGRKKKTYTLVTPDGGHLIADGYEAIEAVRDAIARRPPEDGDVLLFEGEPLPFQISRQPTVTIGAPRVRAKRTAKAKKPSAAKE